MCYDQRASGQVVVSQVSSLLFPSVLVNSCCPRIGFIIQRSHFFFIFFHACRLASKMVSLALALSPWQEVLTKSPLRAPTYDIDFNSIATRLAVEPLGAPAVRARVVPERIQQHCHHNAFLVHEVTV